MPNRGKKIGLLCAMLIISGGWVTLASRSDHEPRGQSIDSGKRPPTQNLALGTPNNPSSVGSAAPSFLADPNFASSSRLDLGNGELFWKMMLSLGLVIALGVATLYLSKRVLPRVARAPGKEIRVLETTGLGPRKALHLVEVGGQRLLLASTNENVTMLTSLNETWRGVPNAEFCVGEPLDVSKPQLGETVKT